MERLTKRINGVVVYVGAKNPYSTGQIPCEVEPAGVREMMDRLAACEDTGLTPEQCENAKVIIESAFSDDTSKAERIRELLKADKDGRLVVLPCKVGDTLFRVFAGEILEHKVGNMRYLAIQGRWDIDTTPFCAYVESSIGKTIFLTREEAEKALEAMKDDWIETLPVLRRRSNT